METKKISDITEIYPKVEFKRKVEDDETTFILASLIRCKIEDKYCLIPIRMQYSSNEKINEVEILKSFYQEFNTEVYRQIHVASENKTLSDFMFTKEFIDENQESEYKRMAIKKEDL